MITPCVTPYVIALVQDLRDNLAANADITNAQVNALLADTDVELAAWREILQVTRN